MQELPSVSSVGSSTYNAVSLTAVDTIGVQSHTQHISVSWTTYHPC